jgi:hypothetical protein
MEETKMLEKQIEHKLLTETRKRDGLCLKFISPGWNGVPDRIVLLPGGKMGFVEVKKPGKNPRTLQLRRHKQIRNLGFQVFILDDPGDIGGLLDAIQGS